MLNIEKYKDEFIAHGRQATYKNHNNIKYNEDVEWRDIVNWLCEEYKEPLLTDSEKEYLKIMFTTFSNSIECISKKLEYKHRQFLQGKLYIEYCSKDGWKDTAVIPYFDSDMFKGLKENENYTLEELEL